ncbi:MAG: aminotransferase class V-fold PLP-dependent enzyme [Gemmatimonadales bacterium]|nr:aminotransferase class V-fold PLP-dependent enzyme [Gemmatimonadales bacterium]MDG2238980.1 aminotransferase class V-fold PLP-dependent enzyme [Longimicrobiales bacterium]MBT3499367.1 aminotransferase class V-fold PLP-dependent enzyme [Gemmatimonadales bacterium]MBT3957735.1 aminotransferase class V-fold PLP-dependent enzyme [Gemmatimonadales bacterium]MBT4913626.1 aminotransferase class V-fold PLP-dependent enzyme [Gemmatimonadales bacterium]
MTDRNLDRREFLVRSSLAAAAIVPIGLVARLNGQAGSGGVQEDWVRLARAEIPASTESAYFQTGGIGPASRRAIAEVAQRLEYQNRGPADPRYSPSMAEIEPNLRAYLSAAFGVGPDGVALTHSTSEGISIAAWSLNWERGDEVVLSNQEHPANVVPWYVLRDRFGIVIREINLDSGTSLLDEVRGVLSSRTRMVSISHVSRNNGRRLRTDESAELGELLRSRGIVYHLDGAQGPGCVEVDFGHLGCDCYSTCGHKWLLGPKGTGAFFVRDDMLDRLQLSWSGSHSHSTMDYEGSYSLLPSAARYEFGTRALADFAGFHTAVSWVEELGFDRVLSRIQHLVSYAVESAEARTGFGLASPRVEADRSGVFVLRLPSGCDATEVYNRLAEEPRVLSSPVRRAGDLRLAIHFFNTEDEIDAAMDGVAALC